VPLALFFLAVGVRGIATRKPFLISSRWYFGVALLGLAPSILLLLSTTRHNGDTLDSLVWLNPMTPVLVFGVYSMWLSSQGFSAFAINDGSFRRGLLAALDELHIPHEETVGSIWLPTVGADLQVGVQSGLGFGQLRAKQWRDGGVLTEVAAAMNRYFLAAPVGVNLTGCVYYCVLGVFMLTVAGVMAIRP